jgi:hypothetical protein
LARTRGHALSDARLSTENVPKLRCWNLRRALELNAIRPDGFEYCFVDEEFVVDREFGLVSK